VCLRLSLSLTLSHAAIARRTREPGSCVPPSSNTPRTPQSPGSCTTRAAPAREVRPRGAARAGPTSRRRATALRPESLAFGEEGSSQPPRGPPLCGPSPDWARGLCWPAPFPVASMSVLAYPKTGASGSTSARKRVSPEEGEGHVQRDVVQLQRAHVHEGCSPSGRAKANDGRAREQGGGAEGREGRARVDVAEGPQRRECRAGGRGEDVREVRLGACAGAGAVAGAAALSAAWGAACGGQCVREYSSEEGWAAPSAPPPRPARTSRRCCSPRCSASSSLCQRRSRQRREGRARAVDRGRERLDAQARDEVQHLRARGGRGAWLAPPHSPQGCRAPSPRPPSSSSSISTLRRARASERSSTYVTTWSWRSTTRRCSAAVSPAAASPLPPPARRRCHCCCRRPRPAGWRWRSAPLPPRRPRGCPLSGAPLGGAGEAGAHAG